jgi:DNA-binding transcriptional ArsR family regulator
LLAVVPPRGYVPDFLTPEAAAEGIGPGVEAIMATRPERLRAELAPIAAQDPSPEMRALAAGEGQALRRLAAAVRHYHDVALAPYWTPIRAQLAADIGIRAGHLLSGGADRLLNTLHPAVRWQTPVLEVDCGPDRETSIDREVRLEGRGLRLIPSFFCHTAPDTLQNPQSSQVLVYPAIGEVTVPAQERWPMESLATLLGATRASVLEAIGVGCTTTELARRVGISPSAASRHAAALRGAGLVHTRRIGSAVHHSLRPLGADLLRQHHGNGAARPPFLPKTPG